MKKKTFIIPFVCLILSFAGILSMTFLRTGFLYYCCSSDGINSVQLARKTSKIWAKCNPNANSYAAVVRANQIRYAFLKAPGDKQVYNKEYFRQNAEYCEKLLDFTKTEMPSEDTNLAYIIEGSQEATYVNEYICSLYLSGDTDKAISYYESYYDNISNDRLYTLIYSCSDFTNYVCTQSDNIEDRERLSKYAVGICERIKADNPTINTDNIYSSLIEDAEFFADADIKLEK